MDSSVSFNILSRSSSDDRSNRGGLSSNIQDISSSLDSWKERRKLKIGSRGQLDVLKRQQAYSPQEVKREPVLLTIAPLASNEDDGETRASGEQESTQEHQRPHEFPFHENVPSTLGNDRHTISSHNISGSHRISSISSSSSGVSPRPTSPVLLSSQLHHLHDGEKAEESRGKEKGESVAKQATTDIRSSQTIITDRSGVVSRPGAELASSSFLPQPTSPVSNRSLSPFSTLSVSATSTHGHGGGDSEICRDEGEEERCLLHLSRRKRATQVLVGRDAQTNAEKDDVVSHLDGRNNSKAIGSDDTNDEKDNTRDVDDGVERRDHQQKNIVTQNLEDDEMWDVDFTAIEATQTLNNENARQKLLLRRKSNLAQRQRPTRTRKRFCSEGESESSNLNVESVTYEKKTRDIYNVDLPETDEYKCSTETSSKIRNEPSEVPLQNVVKERKDPGLQLKKEKDQENRAVLDTAPVVVLRKNSYNSFDNTAGSRKPLIQEISFEGAKPDNPEKTTPFGNLRRTSRHQEFLRSTKGLQSLEDLSDKVDAPQVGAENYNNSKKNSDLRKETNRNSFPNAETQPRVLKAVSRVDKRIFEDGPKTTISTEDDWLKKKDSTPPITTVPQKDSSSNADSKSGQKTEKRSVIRQPLDSGTDNRNTKLLCEKPAWQKKNIVEPRRTISYTFTPPKVLDSNESEEAPWLKEFRNNRKRVARVLNNRDPIKPVSDKPSSLETPSVRIPKPLSSIAGERPSRGVVSGKVAVSTSSSSAAEKKETPHILPEVSATPKYKVERKSSVHNINEGGVSSRMKENRSPVSRNNINTPEPYLPSWSVADAGEAPASLADTRGDIPEWQRKLAEKNKLKKQSFRGTKSEGCDLYGEDYEIDSTRADLEKEKVATMYSQNNDPYATSSTYPQSSASVPNMTSYPGQWYTSQAQTGYYDGYNPNYYYDCNQQTVGSTDMSYSMPYMPATEYQQYDMNYNQNQYAPLTEAYSCDSVNQYEETADPEQSPKLGNLSLSPKNLSDSRSASPKSPRFVRVLPPSSPRKSEPSENSSPSSSPPSSPPPSPSSSPPPDSPFRQRSSSKELPTFSLSNAESQSDGSRIRHSSKPMYVRVLPPPPLPNKLSPEKLREYTHVSPENSPSRIPVPISNESTPKSFKNRLFCRKQDGSGSNASSFVSDDADKKAKAKYKFKIPVSPKFSPFRKKPKSPKQNQSDEENSPNLPVPPQQRSDEIVETSSEKNFGSIEPEKGPYYQILRSPLKTKSVPAGLYSYSMTGEMSGNQVKLRPVPAVESNTPQNPTTPEKTTNTLRRGRRVEDISSTKAVTEDGPPKAQPAWRQQLKNRTSGAVDQVEKKSTEKPDWIKQAEERRARLAKNKLLGE